MDNGDLDSRSPSKRQDAALAYAALLLFIALAMAVAVWFFLFHDTLHGNFGGPGMSSMSRAPGP